VAVGLGVSVAVGENVAVGKTIVDGITGADASSFEQALIVLAMAKIANIFLGVLSFMMYILTHNIVKKSSFVFYLFKSELFIQHTL
jgi:hypothetical protein